MTFEGAIFLLQDDQTLLELREQAYDSEALLQTLLADYPSLLAGDQVDRVAPRRWLLVRREAGVPAKADGGNQWSIDNLFLDQEGIPTIVEVKRSTDTRIRREVVGQMLDYAANAVAYWPASRIRSMFEEWHQSRGSDPDEVLTQFLNQSSEPDSNASSNETFWQTVDANLRAHRVRMLFVADTIPPELQRIIEFLNEQTKTAEVLGLEIRQYVGQNAKTLVPRIIGQTAQAQANKTIGGPIVAWDRERFLNVLSERTSGEVAAAAAHLMDELVSRGWELMWGRGTNDGSCQPVYRHDSTHHIWPLFLWTSDRIQVQYGNMATHPPFDAPGLREEFRDRLRAIQGVALPDGVDLYPSFPISVFVAPNARESLIQTWHWTAEQIAAHAQAPSN